MHGGEQIVASMQWPIEPYADVSAHNRGQKSVVMSSLPRPERTSDAREAKCTLRRNYQRLARRPNLLQRHRKGAN